MSYVHPRLASDIHDWKGVKPITVTPLLDTSRGRYLVAGSVEPGTYVTELRVVGSDLIEFFTQALNDVLSRGFIEIRSGVIPVITGEIIVYEKFSVKESISKFRIVFRTPAQLSKRTLERGRWYRLFPVCEYLAYNLAHLWNVLICDPVIDIDRLVVWSHEHVHETRYRLRTVKVPVGEGRWTRGFVGWVEYTVSSPDCEEKRWFAVLLEFAKYMGVGKSRAIGMGVVDVVFR